MRAGRTNQARSDAVSLATPKVEASADAEEGDNGQPVEPRAGGPRPGAPAIFWAQLIRHSVGLALPAGLPGSGVVSLNLAVLDS